MEDKLIEVLNTLKYPVFRQGSLTKDEPYPESFFTFWNYESPDHAYYDNSDYGTNWSFGVYAYSSDPATTYQMITDARTKLKENDFIVPSKGFDASSDEESHTGRGISVYYLEV